MSLVEINFDGIVGPTHNYAGLSRGNLASAHNAGRTAHPRAAALQGIAKMRANLDAGLAQGFFLPPDRPNERWLASLSADLAGAPPHLRAQAYSASSMWTANAGTVSPAPDTADGRCHITVANLVTMPHRSHEWPATLAQLRLAFANSDHFVVHAPVPPPFGDEGAANHMRLAPAHDAPGIEVFVYGRGGGSFPARQHRDASEAIARMHRLDPARVLFVEQAEAAIAAGAFHNDVVAVANGPVLFTHEQAFADPARLAADLQQRLPEVQIVTVPAADVSLAEAIGSYLFNAQLLTVPDRDAGMELVLPMEAASGATRAYLDRLIAGNGPIRRLRFVDLKQSMANGGGPACLRLRVVADPARIDPRFIATPALLDRIAGWIGRHWPETLDADDLADPALPARVRAARRGLLDLLDLAVLA